MCKKYVFVVLRKRQTHFRPIFGPFYWLWVYFRQIACAHRDATITAVVKVTSQSGSVLITTNSSRLFQRFVPAASGPPGSVVQLDRHRRAVLVDGAVYQGNGWYVAGGDFTYNFTTAVTSMSLHGYNMVMVYSFEKVAPGHIPTPAEFEAFLDHCESVGMQVIFDFMPWWQKYSYCAANMTAGCDLAGTATAFEQMAAVGARSKSLLGYYVCDDCCSLSSAQTSAQSTHGYSKLKLLDRYHPTIGAVNCDDMASHVHAIRRYIRIACSPNIISGILLLIP